MRPISKTILAVCLLGLYSCHKNENAAGSYPVRRPMRISTSLSLIHNLDSGASSDHFELYAQTLDLTYRLDTAVLNDRPLANRVGTYDVKQRVPVAEFDASQPLRWTVQVENIGLLDYTFPVKMPTLTADIPDSFSISRGLVIRYTSDAQAMTFILGRKIYGNGIDGQISCTPDELNQLDRNGRVELLIYANKVQRKATETHQFDTRKMVVLEKTLFAKP